MPKLVADSLQEHLPAHAEAGTPGIVFPAPTGGFLRRENFRKRVCQPAVAAAGVAPLRLHDLRHTCASLAIAAARTSKVLERMLGARDRVWLPAVQRAGLDGLRFHDLRHTAGTLAAPTGATTKELMARLGHASPAPPSSTNTPPPTATVSSPNASQL